MKRICLKTPRMRLAPEDYRELCNKILERDRWRCQSCGSMQRLQVHHRKFRSHLGADSEGNLITLCERCHLLAHRRGQRL